MDNLSPWKHYSAPDAKTSSFLVQLHCVYKGDVNYCHQACYYNTQIESNDMAHSLCGNDIAIIALKAGFEFSGIL